jgi:hypothetical protein
MSDKDITASTAVENKKGGSIMEFEVNLKNIKNITINVKCENATKCQDMLWENLNISLEEIEGITYKDSDNETSLVY